jgi:hypothetical protein
VKTSKHAVDHGGLNDGFTGFGVVFVIDHETPIPHEPREGAFHHPASRVDLETVFRVGRDCHRPTAHLADELLKPLGEPAVSDHLTHPCQQVPDAAEQPTPAVPVLDIGRQHRQCPDQPEGIDADEPLATAYLFSPRRTLSGRHGESS